MCVDQEQFCPGGNILYCLETFLVSQLGGGEKGATGTGQVKPKMLLNVLQCTWQFPRKKELSGLKCQSYGGWVTLMYMQRTDTFLITTGNPQYNYYILHSSEIERIENYEV